MAALSFFPMAEVHMRFAMYEVDRDVREAVRTPGEVYLRLAETR